MADVHTKQTRSYNMSRIRSKNTKPEMRVRTFLHAKGFRYKLHDKKLPGKPDIVLPKYNTVIFIHGCFWHGHNNCKYFVVPKTRTSWWLHKINTNKINDAKALAALRKQEWKIITIWECKLKTAKLEKTLSSLLKKMLTVNM
jgi:DNA mismatch endonuclease, patch repair protein